MAAPAERPNIFEPDEPIEFDTECVGTCVCGLPISVGYANGRPTVLHPLPMCEAFMRIESPIEFLAHVNNVQMTPR